MNGDAPDHEPADETGLLGAADIVAAFTALRHELKLQVRAGRDLAAGLEGTVVAALERSFGQSPAHGIAQRLDAIGDRLGRLETSVVAAARPTPAAGDPLRGLAVALAEIEESLERATVAVAEQAESVGLDAMAGVQDGDNDEHDMRDDHTAADAASPDPTAAWDDCVGRAPWLVRTLAAGLIARLRIVFDDALAQAATDGVRRAEAASEPLAAAATALADAGQGLELLLARTRRLMTQAGVQRIDVLHEPFDAERMRAVDVVEDAEVPEGHVAEQFRPGYLLHGAVLRPAEVRVSR